MSVVEYIRYKLEPGTEDAFVAAYAQAQRELEASPPCLSWELTRGHETPEQFILRIEWTSLDGHMKEFRRSHEFRRFLGHIKPYIDDIEEMSHYERTAVASRPSICDALGGPAVLFRIAETMHTSMKSDAQLGALFGHAAPTHVPHLGMWLCEVFGGPKLWSAVFDDIGGMLRRHGGGAFSERQRARFVELAVQATEACAPEASAAARKAVASYFEWGSQIAVENSQPDHVLDPSAGVPTWPWPDEED
ncbi:MAG: antibiotic biosynthesis monooxygenase [Myxococcota bacterium]